MQTATVFLLVVAVAASQYVPQVPNLRFINRQTDAVTVNADGTDLADGEVSKFARVALPNVDGKSLFASKFLKANVFKANVLCGSPLRLASIDSAAQIDKLNEFKDLFVAGSGESRFYWISHIKIGEAGANPVYYLLNKPGAAFNKLTGFTAPTAAEAKDCIQVKVTAPAKAGDNPTIAFVGAACTDEALFLCEQDFASNNPLFDRVF